MLERLLHLIDKIKEFVQPVLDFLMIEQFLHEFQRPLANPVLVFSVILLIILLSPIVLRKLRIPGIVGLIISGLVIGPYGLNLIERNSAVDLFSTIGLLYIMFIAGLELDLNEFRRQRNKSVVFGLLTFFIPLAIGYPVCHYLLGYGVYSSLLIASMFSTHTLVAYPIVSRLGISKNQVVAITVGGTILTDTAVLIMLAVIMSSSQGGVDQTFWIELGVAVTLFTIVMFFIIPRIASWFFKKFESEKHTHYIFVLSVVFFAAFLAEISGLEPIIGAFVAGLALNRLIPHSSSLMNRIEFIGSSLFIPFFLISVGMLVDVRVIFKGTEALIVAGVLSVVAIFGKWFAAWGTQILFRYTRVQRQLIFGLSSAHAAATIAVILVAYKGGLVDENILNGTIILILITCVVSSVATENAAKKIIVAEASSPLPEAGQADMKEKILMPVANPQNAENLFDFSAFIKDKAVKNPITVLSIVINNREAEQNLRKAKTALQFLEKQAAANETNVHLMVTLDNNAAGGIVRVAKEEQANVLVLGWPQRAGVIDFIIGNKMESIIHNHFNSIFICHFAQPLMTHKRMVLAIPPLAEHEPGFQLWLDKIARLASEISLSMLCFCDEKTKNAVQKFMKKNKISLKIQFEIFENWNAILKLSSKLRSDDILLLVSSRKGNVSYINALENLPYRMEKYFENYSRIIIFPEQPEVDYINERYDDIETAPFILKGVETLERLGKGVGGIFKKTD